MEDTLSYAAQPEEQAMLEYQHEIEKLELSSRMTDIEENGLYVRNLLNHINDKLVQPVASSIVPAITLIVSSSGTIATVVLGTLYMISKFR